VVVGYGLWLAGAVVREGFLREVVLALEARDGYRLRRP